MGLNPSWSGGYCFPSGCCCSEGSGLPEQDGCFIWGLAQHQDPGSHFLSSFPKASVPSFSFNLSGPLCPQLCQGSAVLGSLLQLLIWSLCTQQSGWSTTEPRQRPSWGWGYNFPSGYCHSEGSGLPEHDGCCHLGMSQLQDPSGVYCPCFLPKVSIPSLSPPLPEPRGSGCKWKFVCWPFKWLSIFGGEQPCHFSLLVGICVLFGLWCSRLEILA